MSQYCSGLIAIVLHEQPWSLIWSFHECFTVFVAIQDTFFLGKQRPTHKTITPQHVGTGGWGIRVVGRKTMENTLDNIQNNTQITRKNRNAANQHTNTEPFFLPVVCGLFSLIIFDVWYFCCYVPALESVWGLWITTLIYVYICICIIFLHLWKWRRFYKLWPI